MIQRVLCDIDGVVGNFLSLYLDALNICFPDYKIPRDWVNDHFEIYRSLGISKQMDDEIFKFIKKPGIAKCVDLCRQAKFGVLSVAEISDLYFVTKPIKGSASWCGDRISWLQTHFGDELASKYVFTRNKEIVDGDVLIDDKISNCEKWLDVHNNSVAICWSQVYNAGIIESGNFYNGMFRTNRWSDVIKIIEWRDYNGFMFRTHTTTCDDGDFIS